MVSSDWSDYVSAAEEHAEEGASIADIAGDLHDATDVASLNDAVPDTIVNDLGNAAYQADLGAGSESWSEWHAEVGDDAAASAQDYLDYANDLAASGDTELAQSALETAQMYAESAGDSYDTAGDYAVEAGDYLQEADSYVDSAVATDESFTDVSSYDAGAYDTSSYDSGGYDAGSYDAGSYDSGSSDV